MTFITIREQPNSTYSVDGITSAQATVSFDHSAEYPITISDPFTEKEEKQLAWYFEKYLNFPFMDQVKAQHAAASIVTYGEKLFDNIFANRNAYARYKECLPAGLNTLQFEIVGSPAFHRWHWEALKDPEVQQPFALQATIVRKNIIPQHIEATVRPSPTINVLVVCARPSGQRDVGYRTISRPLVEALRNANLRVQVEILRPGTYKALDKHLSEITSRHQVGYYHMIHFDVHGAVLSYDQLQKALQANRSLYQQPYGRTPIHPYEGNKAFLFLEDEQEQIADPVEAQALADLLVIHQIPIAILNACQSGLEIGASESSLGSRLMQAGIQLVLAMGYSVTVSAAELMMRTLYEQLFAKQELSTAISLARQELYKNKERKANFDQVITLEDWLLPIIYQNQPQHLAPRPFTLEESKAYYDNQAVSYQATLTESRFVGRDLDILYIEKRLLTKRNLLLVRGMGGAGKTTLLQHLGEWWQKTGFVGQVCYFGYDEKAWTLQQLITTIAHQLYTKQEYKNDFQPLPLMAQQARLAQSLRAERHLFILDNLESITGSRLAIKNTLVKKEQEALHGFLKNLAGGRTLVLLGSRSGEEWLAKETFGENVYDLGGLDPEAASILTSSILTRYGLTHYRADPVLQQLVKQLDGFPLALEVVLANLQQQTPQKVLDALQAGDVTLHVGDSEKKTENILRCVDYSHSNLSPDAQQLLMCLAPFTFVVNRKMLDYYTKYLEQQPALSALPFERWQEVIQETVNWGLLHADANFPDYYLHIQPVLPYFLRSHLANNATVRYAIEIAFREFYNHVSSTFCKMLDSNNPSESQLGQALVQLDYENLLTAVKLDLADQDSPLNPYIALRTYLDLNQDHQQSLELGQMVSDQLGHYSVEKLSRESLDFELASVIHYIADTQRKLKKYDDARASYRRMLSLLKNIHDPTLDATRAENGIYYDLGIVEVETDNWEEAEKYNYQALQGYIHYGDRSGQARTYHQSGMIAQGQRKWEEAIRYFKSALQLRIEDNKRYEQAEDYYHLGAVAQEQRKWEEATEHYQQALQIYREYNDIFELGAIYHNLGLIAQTKEEWMEAEEDYQLALSIYITYNERFEQSNIYLNLGIIALQQEKWEEAQHYYEQAIVIAKEYNDNALLAHTYALLGTMQAKREQWKEAEEYCQQALQIYNKHDEPYKRGMVNNTLGLIAQGQKQWAQAEDYFLQNLQIYIACDDHYQQASAYINLGNMALELSRWEKSRDYLLHALVLLMEYQEYSDYLRATMSNLAQLWLVSGDATLPAAIAPNLGITADEVEHLLRHLMKD